MCGACPGARDEAPEPSQSERSGRGGVGLGVLVGQGVRIGQEVTARGRTSQRASYAKPSVMHFSTCVADENQSETGAFTVRR